MLLLICSSCFMNLKRISKMTQLYKAVCCGKVTKTPRDWDVCWGCGKKNPILEEVDKEDAVFVMGIKEECIRTSVGSSLLVDDKKYNQKNAIAGKKEKMDIDPLTLKEYRKQALTHLRSQAEADKDKALLSLSILLDHPAGIGDHSTGDLYANLNEALSALADADDRIDTLERYFQCKVL